MTAASNAPVAPGVALPILEVDDELVDDGNSYQDELSTYSTSLASSAMKYRKENGRSYHAYREGRYLFPNDQKESDRLDILHEMTACALDQKLFLAPIGDSPGPVLDLGTGTGRWAIEFADEYTSAEVIGNDLSPNQPKFVPPNVKFVVDDFEDEWAYGGMKFDFIHARYLSGAVRDFPGLLKKAYDNTKPGGWVEFQDYNTVPYSDDGTSKGSAIEQYFRVTIDAFGRAGTVANPGRHLEGWFRDAGFVDIRVEKFRIPFGMWPRDEKFKKLGTWNLMQLESGLESGALASLTRYMSWTPEEVKVLADRALNDVKNPKIHALFDFYVVCGKKPTA